MIREKNMREAPTIPQAHQSRRISSRAIAIAIIVATLATVTIVPLFANAADANAEELVNATLCTPDTTAPDCMASSPSETDPDDVQPNTGDTQPDTSDVQTDADINADATQSGSSNAQPDADNIITDNDTDNNSDIGSITNGQSDTDSGTAANSSPNPLHINNSDNSGAANDAPATIAASADVAWAKYDENDTAESKTALEGSQWTLSYIDGDATTIDYPIEDNTSPQSSAAAQPDTDTANETLSARSATVEDSDARAGYFKVADLPDGSYSLTETVAPTGFTLNPTVFEFTVSDGAVAWSGELQPDSDGVLWIPDAPTEVVWSVIDGTSGAALPGTTWDIYNSGPDTVLATIQDCVDVCPAASVNNWAVDTDPAPGSFSVKYLPVNGYYLHESEAPRGYSMDADWRRFQVTSAAGIIKISGDGASGEIVLYRILGMVQWTKVSSEDDTQILPGAQWTLEYTSDTGQTKTTTFIDCTGQPGCLGNNGLATISDQTISYAFNGVITVAGLGWGFYVLKEIKAPDGYVLDATPITFTIDATNVWGDEQLSFDFTITNRPEGMLPSTGGPGTSSLLAAGITLTLIALLGLTVLTCRP